MILDVNNLNLRGKNELDEDSVYTAPHLKRKNHTRRKETIIIIIAKALKTKMKRHFTEGG
jgi:hypothetical protein